MITKKWKSKFVHPNGWCFQIWRATMVDMGQRKKEASAFFLYVTDKEGHLLFDHCQDELEIAQGQALDQWNVPLNSWVEIPVDSPAY